MALSQRLDLRQTQALVMTPQLQQAIKLLQLSNIELTAFVEQELEQNPLLEIDDSDHEGRDATTSADPVEEPAAPPSNQTATLGGGDPPLAGEDIDQWHAASGSEGEGDVDFAGDAEAWRLQAGTGDSGELPGLEQGVAQTTTLRDHLLTQLGLDIIDPADRIIGVYLVDLLDDAGYLTGDLAAAAEALGCDLARVETVLAKLQRFDPPGIFARNLSECLALQLRECNRLDPAMQMLLANLPLLAARDAPALMRLCGVDAADLSDMITEIRALNPKPGLALDTVTAAPVVPDITMRPQPLGGWIIELNQETLPRVLVNNRYYATLSRSSSNKVEKEYLAERLQSANWLVKSLHQRATTILRVATEIVNQQSIFFTHGVQFLRPLILRDIAVAINMHESTVSRVTTNKFMATPRGIYELKYFFSSSIQASSGGDAHSAEAVRYRIKALIEAELRGEVLSDERIVDILQKDGVDIARRTVAKYRESLHIPSSVQRRRDKSMQM
ncbi:MAG: rpoN [Rhodospirillales bacterium]|jgi:RNA polymerase sigma-54 factor|nr:rpoN [Rhodospirillales bacterium]